MPMFSPCQPCCDDTPQYPFDVITTLDCNLPYYCPPTTTIIIEDPDGQIVGTNVCKPEIDQSTVGYTIPDPTCHYTIGPKKYGTYKVTVSWEPLGIDRVYVQPFTGVVTTVHSPPSLGDDGYPMVQYGKPQVLFAVIDKTTLDPITKRWKLLVTIPIVDYFASFRFSIVLAYQYHMEPGFVNGKTGLVPILYVKYKFFDNATINGINVSGGIQPFASSLVHLRFPYAKDGLNIDVKNYVLVCSRHNYDDYSNYQILYYTNPLAFVIPPYHAGGYQPYEQHIIKCTQYSQFYNDEFMFNVNYTACPILTGQLTDVYPALQGLVAGRSGKFGQTLNDIIPLPNNTNSFNNGQGNPDPNDYIYL